MRIIKVTSQDEGQRLDKFLSKFMPDAPKSFFYKMMRKKNIVLNGKKAEGMERVSKGDEIKLFLSDETIENFQKKSVGVFSLPEYKLDIIYEDEDILIVNKPVGMLSQKADKDDISLVEYVAEYLNQSGKTDKNTESTFSAGICNRLDRNTSGLIVAGKTVKGLQWMNLLFRQRDLYKYYLCIVKGYIDKAARIDGYLVKNENHNNVTVTKEEVEGASRIITEYEPLQYGFLRDDKYTLLKVHLVTGKSHQIRAHLKSIGHPVIGDAKYGYKDVYRIFRREFGLKHQLLHAWQLNFGDTSEIPEKYHNMIFEAPVPNQFADIMKGLGMKRL